MDSKVLKKQNELKRLNQRKEQLSTQHKKVAKHNEQVEGKLKVLEGQVMKLRAVNVELSQMLEEEFLKEKQFSQRVEAIEVEAKDLEQKYLTLREQFNNKARDVVKLERELEKLTAKKKAFEKYIKLTHSSEIALITRSNSIKRRLKDTNTYLMSSPKKADKSLSGAIARVAGKDLKEASTLYTCAQEIIKKIESNEFEGLKYRYKVNKNQSYLGARIFFSNITTQYNDLVKELSPLARDLGKRFSSIGLDIKTKANRSPNGVVKELDMTVVIDLQHKKNGVQRKADKTI